MMVIWGWEEGDSGSELGKSDGSDINRISLENVDIRSFPVGDFSFLSLVRK